jgi:hypothetical protein
MKMNQQTNQISRTAASILMYDIWKSLPLRLEHITDATAPIGTVLDRRQASCEDGKGNFRNCSMMMPSISVGFQCSNTLNASTGVHISNANLTN